MVETSFKEIQCLLVIRQDFDIRGFFAERSDQLIVAVEIIVCDRCCKLICCYWVDELIEDGGVE